MRVGLPLKDASVRRQDCGRQVAMNHLSRIFVIAVVLLAGCGGEPEPPVEKRAHVWQEQINTMDKARDVDTLLQDSAAAQRRAIDAQTQ